MIANSFIGCAWVFEMVVMVVGVCRWLLIGDLFGLVTELRISVLSSVYNEL